MAAGELMVMDVVTWSSGMPSKSSSMSARDVTATPHFPTSPSDSGWSGSRPMSVGRSKATDRPCEPCSSRYLKRSFVSRGLPKPGELAHRPGLAAVHRAVDAARVRELPGVAEVARVVDGRGVRRAVERLDGTAGDRRVGRLAFRGRSFVLGPFSCALPNGDSTASGGRRPAARCDCAAVVPRRLAHALGEPNGRSPGRPAGPPGPPRYGSDHVAGAPVLARARWARRCPGRSAPACPSGTPPA